jgi:peptide/nickel transport system ATP-binding protein
MLQLRELRREYGFATLLISHDLSLMAQECDRIAVMYAGRIVEMTPVRDLFTRPLHPYSKALMDAFPPVSGPRRRLAGIAGAPPDLAAPPVGCRFHPRCALARPECSRREPALVELEPGREVACLVVQEGAGDLHE